MSSYQKKQDQIKAERAENFASYFADWGVEGGAYRRVVGSIGQANRAYKKGKGRTSYLTDDELAVTVRAVEMLGDSKRGLSLSRLQDAFAVGGIGRSHPKASAALRALLAIGLIVKTKGHSKGHSGAKYRLTEQAKEALKEK